MENKKDIIDIIYSEHTSGHEKLEVIKDTFDAVFNSKHSLNKVHKYLALFNKHIEDHFKKEELMIKIMKKECALSEEETSLIHDILKEHNMLLKKFNFLSEAAGVGDVNKRKEKKILFRLINDLTESIMKHAEKEDDCLYPIVREKLDPEHLQQLESLINK